MRKVTRDAVAAFLAGKSGTFGNTTVTAHRMILHGNTIAVREDDGTIRVTLAGWPTPTTRERLNGLLEAFCSDCPPVTTADGYTYNPRPGFYQHKGEQYLDVTPSAAPDVDAMYDGLPTQGRSVVRVRPDAWYTINRRGELVNS